MRAQRQMSSSTSLSGGSIYLRTNVVRRLYVKNAYTNTFPKNVPAHKCDGNGLDFFRHNIAACTPVRERQKRPRIRQTSLETVKRSLRESHPLWVSFGVSAASQKSPRAAGGSATGQEKPSTRTSPPPKKRTRPTRRRPGSAACQKRTSIR
jgi:hypothetical protein